MQNLQLKLLPEESRFPLGRPLLEADVKLRQRDVHLDFRPGFQRLGPLIVGRPLDLDRRGIPEVFLDNPDGNIGVEVPGNREDHVV